MVLADVGLLGHEPYRGYSPSEWWSRNKGASSNFQFLRLSEGDTSFHLGHRMPIVGRIVTGDRVLQLPLDVGEQAACPDSEKRRMQPGIAKLFFH